MLILFGFYIFSLPYFSDREPFNYVVYGLFALLSGVVLIYRFLYYGIRRFNFRALILPAFAAYSLIGTVIFSHQFRYLLTVALLAFSYIVIYFMFEEINNNKLIIRIVIYSLLAFVLLFCIHYRADIFDYSNFESKRLASDNYFDNVNSIANYFAGCCVLSLYCVLYSKKRITLLFIVPFLLCFYLGVLTASRAFIVSVSLSAIIVFIVRFRRNPAVLLSGLVSLSVLVILFFSLPAFETLKKRLVDMFNMITGSGYSTDFSTATRVLWQDYATFLGSQHLLFGNGLNGFEVYSGTGTYSHANFAELICDVGVVGALLFYLVFIISIIDLFRKKFEYSPLVIALLVFLISREFLSISYTSKINSFFFALIMFSSKDGIVRNHNYQKELKINYYYVEI